MFWGCNNFLESLSGDGRFNPWEKVYVQTSSNQIIPQAGVKNKKTLKPPPSPVIEKKRVNITHHNTFDPSKPKCALLLIHVNPGPWRHSETPHQITSFQTRDSGCYPSLHFPKSSQHLHSKIHITYHHTSSTPDLDSPVIRLPTKHQRTPRWFRYPSHAHGLPTYHGGCERGKMMR